MTVRAGGLRLADAKLNDPRVLNLGFVIESEGGDMEEQEIPRIVQDGEWERGMKACGGLKVKIGTNTQASSMTGETPPGQYPFKPNLLKDATGAPFTAEHLFTSDDMQCVHTRTQLARAPSRVILAPR